MNGVQENLISFRQATLGKWVAVVGGGDPYEVAYAIYKAVPDISILTNDVSNPSGAKVEKKTIPVTVYPDVYQVPFVVPSSKNVVVLITRIQRRRPTSIRPALQKRCSRISPITLMLSPLASR